MADFAHLMDTMSRMRQSGIPPPRDPNMIPDLTATPYFVGKTSQAVIEKVMSSAPGGDFVVRESERVPNSLVLMLKTSPTTGMQRRIVFRDGRFTMDINGTKCSHEYVRLHTAHHITAQSRRLREENSLRSLDRLLQLESQCRRPVGHKVLAAFSSAAARQDTRSSHSSASTGLPPVHAVPLPPTQSSRDVLEAAMTAAEHGDFSKAMKLADKAKVMGASARNLSKAVEYIKSIAPPGALEVLHPAHPVQPPRRISSSGTSEFSVLVLDGQDATRLMLGGEALCTVSSECTLTLIPHGGSHARSDHRWPLPLLRRYGRKGDCFYFESGRRCASGPATLFLQSSNTDAIFSAVEVQLALFRAKVEKEEAAKTAAIAAVQEQKRQEEARLEAERAAAIAKYEKDAERQVLLEQEQQRQAEAARKAEEARLRDEEACRDNETESVKYSEARRSIMHRRNSAAMKRQEQAKHLTLSKKAEAGFEPKSRTKAADLFGGDMKQEEEWGAGKSKIWKALNPKPLFYETAKDRRERSEAVDLGVVGGGRNFNAMRDVLSPELSAAMDRPNTTSPHSITHPIMEEDSMDTRDDEIQNEEADDDDVADQFTESVDPDAALQDGCGATTADDIGTDDDDDEGDDGEVAELDSGLIALLEKNRAQRAKEEEDHKRKLREEYNRAQRAKQEELDKELAVIAVKKKLEKEMREREREEAVKEAQRRIETELVFDFTFN